MTLSRMLTSTPNGRRALALARLVRMAKADGWDARDKARPQYVGPEGGHYPDCMGWEDCQCASYPNPYRPAGDA